MQNQHSLIEIKAASWVSEEADRVSIRCITDGCEWGMIALVVMEIQSKYSVADTARRCCGAASLTGIA